MVDFRLSPEQEQYRETARAFAERELRPLAARLLRPADQERSPWEIVRPVFRQAVELGFTKILIPEEYGGMGGGALDNVVVMEELGAADLGIAASYINVSATAPILVLKGGNEAQRRKWLTAFCEDDDHVLASAGSEPNVAGADSFCPIPDPRIGLKSTALRAGNEYVLNGAKAGFCTNAPAARTLFVMARTDLAKPAMLSSSLFIVPSDLPGVSIGKKNHLMGWKTALHSEVYFDNVRVPAENRIGEEGANLGLFFGQAIPYLASGLAAAYLGLARAAYELAFDYAHERVSWGQAIVNHQAVALKLADMVADLEAARLMVYKLAWAADRGLPEAAGVLSPAAKTLAVDVAIRNSERLLKIMGAYGTSDEYPAGRYLNDAWVGDACDGTRDMLRLGIVQYLRMQAGKLSPPGFMGAPSATGNQQG